MTEGEKMIWAAAYVHNAVMLKSDADNLALANAMVTASRTLAAETAALEDESYAMLREMIDDDEAAPEDESYAMLREMIDDDEYFAVRVWAGKNLDDEKTEGASDE